MASVELQHIDKSYGSFQAIGNLNLSIEDGSFTVFVGPSGCGKSTLLRMIAGLEKITAGELQIDGRRMNDADPIERGVAMVFQNYALYPHMTVEQNIGFSLRMAGMGKAEIERNVAAAATTLQIEPLMKRKPAQLSGGQRQRVAIGRAIVRNPAVFLFDEPLSNLDAELRVSMRVEIAKLHRRIGATMIYVTHDQTEAMTLADKIVVMRAGKIEQIGTPDTLYADPDNLFVAGFIGSPRMNFLDGTLGADGLVRLECGAVLRPGTLHAAGDIPIKLGIRPEHFVGRDDAGGAIDLKVDVVENLGGTRFIYGTANSGQPVIVEDRSETARRPGDTVTAGFPASRALLFGADGQRIREARRANGISAE
ncbi:sn-glycerol-3-phosphate ABC transporter ATP-binding protein UgpC [Rhizobium ruizarguesonis]|uniref:ABC transporter ATP-binding protein n=1 Tax=Rhizobium ruizarguesonis TaxID=2081791 RepID=UPI0010320107|nr:sn-glycerol-3-phosphate ABC transporter ATP-binding protein UgpC [Rhizobium ruizarguesonis]TAU17135.1 sn-glycerol-3-phosphate ABC transporter ATP-binding protein UgpC [Rhizobium ruizarguesonis]TAU57523.1 sn-glycerol-3-phosphate ABC transporter ATP-binding protein UgpC [Rhizobium ruizarguesonis]TAV03534.1 sn-glycerol-3-phosphate ABC transporter ATP-binding protein UgpC [Rhizobium ruizarguesonis]TAV19724.1 sn-glycerol-3-phosphate ABC transporter ATP-binding protein UgpC [Rhizobium ruizargueson